MRYKDNGQLDDPSLLDGDESFSGFASKYEKDSLEPGLLSYAQNIRLDRGKIALRKTAEGISSDSDRNYVENTSGGFLDMISYNDGDGDQLLYSTPLYAFLHSGNSDETHTLINYPTAWEQGITNGFLIQTTGSTLIFPTESISLPFTLDSTAELGEQVARLEESPIYSQSSSVIEGTEKKFVLHKQVGLQETGSQVGDTRVFTCDEIPSWNIGEKIEVWRDLNNNLGAYEVTEITGRVVSCVPCDTNTRPTWGAFNNLSKDWAMAYSLEDQCPPGLFATWAGNRLVVPTGKHDLAISSPLSTHDFPIYNKLTIGSEDGGKITALEPLVDDSLVCFKNSSVYIVGGVYSMLPADQGGSLSITRISDQMGCVNNRCKVIIGTEVMFLSHQGLYALSLNAKGEGGIGLPPQAVRITDMPLSRDVEDLLYEFGEVGYWGDFEYTQMFFNRGRLYVFTDAFFHWGYEQYFTGALIYNTLLSKWESLDLYRSGFDKIAKVTTGNESKLFMWNQNYGIVQIEKHEDHKDVYNDTDWNVAGWFKTRGYRFKTFADKILRRVMVSGAKLNGDTTNSVFEFYVNTENPDRETKISDTIKDGSFNHKVQVKKHGESMSIEGFIYATQFEVKRIVLEARDALRQTFQRN